MGTTQTILPVFVISLSICLGSLDAEPQPDLKTPSPGVTQVLETYCEALGTESWDDYRKVFHVNGHPDAEIKDAWIRHDSKVTVSKSEILFEDDDIMIVKLSADIRWLDYKPQFTSEEKSVIVLRKEEEEWKVWSVTQIDTQKKG